MKHPGQDQGTETPAGTIGMKSGASNHSSTQAQFKNSPGFCQIETLGKEDQGQVYQEFGETDGMVKDNRLMTPHCSENCSSPCS